MDRPLLDLLSWGPEEKWGPSLPLGVHPERLGPTHQGCRLRPTHFEVASLGAAYMPILWKGQKAQRHIHMMKCYRVVKTHSIFYTHF